MEYKKEIRKKMIAVITAAVKNRSEKYPNMEDKREIRKKMVAVITTAVKNRSEKVKCLATLSDITKGGDTDIDNGVPSVNHSSRAFSEGERQIDQPTKFTLHSQSTPTTPPSISSQPLQSLLALPTSPPPPLPRPITPIAAMQRQRGNLPTERGYAPAAIPQYMAFNQQQSTDSTGSQDSIMTQVPLPYHLLDTNSYSQDFNSYAGNEQRRAMYNSSALGHGHLQGGSNGSSKSLNPASTPYVPAGFPPSQMMMMDSSGLQNQGVYQGENDGYARGGQQYQQQEQGQIGGVVSYLPPNPYRLSDNTTWGGLSDGTPQFQQGVAPNPYGKYEGATGVGEYSSYNVAQQPGNYGASHHGNQMQGYPGTNLNSPATSYAVSPAHNYQSMNMPYGPGTPNGMASSNGQGQSGGWGQQYNNPHASVQLLMYQNNNRQQHGKNSSFNSGNDNRNDKGSHHGKQDFGTRHTNQHSNLGTAPVRTYNQPPNQNLANTGSKLGGPVQQPLKKSVRLPGSVKSSNASTRQTSPERRSNSVERRSSHTTEKTEVDNALTPGPKPHQLDVEFSSESRHTETPQLRSRRGQSISTASTDPSRKSTINNWLDNTPTLEHQGSADQAHLRRSPPKMLSLITGGDGDGILAPINEADPFSVGPPPGGGFNPFLTAKNAAAIPLSGNRLGMSAGMSGHLRHLTDGGRIKPSVDVALDPRNLPFVEYCRQAKEDTWGVIKIKNIPYSVNRPEVLAFLGRNARIVSEHDHEPVHIVMERVTSKTLDCYVEFVNFNEALNAVNRFETNRSGGRGGRLGQRHVEIELSSQEQLMKDLFPKAKNVRWKSGRPEIIPRDPNDQYNSGFQGFVSKEELVMLVKHVEAPQRSPFSKDCPQRPFECLISTLLKYPWYMVDDITIQDRNLIHNATKELLTLLVDRVNNEKENVNLTPMLLKRAWRAALKCPGFTPSMKDDIVCICNIDGHIAMEFGLAPHASHWNHLWTIGPKAGAPVDLIMWYITLIRESTSQAKQQLTLAEQAAQGPVDFEEKLFGDLDKFIDYPRPLAFQSLADVARAEWTAIEKVLRRALTPALE